MKLKQGISLLLLALLAQSALAKSNAKKDRWFEIEVILFEQLGDKSEIKEQFPAQTSLPKYRKVIDILSPYLQPDIASLKQQLPLCSAPTYPLPLVEQSKLPKLHNEKSLEEIQQLYFPDENVLDEFETIENSQNNNLDGAVEVTSIPEANISTSEEEYNAEELKNTDESLPVIEEIITLTPEQIALVAQAEKAFSDYPLSYHDDVNKHFSRKSLLCAIPENIYQQKVSTQKQQDYLYFPVAQVPSVLDGAEDWYGRTPYIISKDSLKLGNITTQLRRSKNFKPLLHMGWRQITKTKRLAVPVKIFAGDNLALDYQTQLTNYQRQAQEAAEQENNLMQALNTGANDLALPATPVDPAIAAEERKQALVKQRVSEIIEQALNDDNLTLADASNETDNTLFDSLSENTMLSPPEAPLQPWFLDGFIKVEVDHYLHITADFSMLNASLAQQASERLKPDSSLELRKIRFEQNKRVISKEIHYFDHPYMGMIIQIRTHKQRERSNEEETLISN